MGSSVISPTPGRSHLRSLARSAVLQAAHRMNTHSLFIGNTEPSLDDIMGDPMVRNLMARDGVAEDSLRVLIDQIRSHLR